MAALAQPGLGRHALRALVMQAQPGAITALLLLIIGAVPAALAAPLQSASPGAPVITRTGKGPTGYQVTFRLHDPSARSVRIKGSWLFGSAASTSADQTNRHPVMPAAWRPGNFPLQSPNTPSENWAVQDMALGKPGEWLVTIPLPPGTFDYQFYRDCDAPQGSVAGCQAMTDPAAPAWNAGLPGATPATFSQVFVPHDPRFGGQAAPLEQDAPPARRGTLQERVYKTPNAPSGTHSLAVYLPARYDPNRAEPYPLLVLSHGGGENETTWSTRGRMQKIIDNLIAAGTIEPLVVVMPNGSGLTDGSYPDEILNHVLPLAHKTFHVSPLVRGRAFAGTSAYGGQANVLLFQHPGSFGYYGIWSPAFGAPALENAGIPGRRSPPPTAPAYQAQTVRSVAGIHLAIGLQDTGGNAPMLTTMTERTGFINAGVPITEYLVPGGHTWSFWRGALADFLRRVAFRPVPGAPAQTDHSK